MTSCCKPVRFGAVVGIVCTRGHRPPRCGCGAPSTRLCDWPKIAPRRKSRTCDANLCDACRRVDGDRDYCQHHVDEQLLEQPSTRAYTTPASPRPPTHRAAYKSGSAESNAQLSLFGGR